VTGSAGGTGGSDAAGTSGASGAAGATGTAGTGAVGPVIKIDSAGVADGGWVADVDFTGGNVAQINNGAVDLTGVTNPAPQSVYQTNRMGASFYYTIPGYQPSSTHLVRLHFCETYFPPAGDTMGGSGRRTCNVSINGTLVLLNFDIFAKTGAKMKADIEQFSVAANASGQFVILFEATKDNCQIGGIEVE
jgi:hypothetical protein